MRFSFARIKKQYVIPAVLSVVLTGCSVGYEPSPIVVTPDENRSRLKTFKPGAEYRSQVQDYKAQAVNPVVTEPEIDIDRKVKAALLLPLSGKHQGLGTRMLNAATMAQDDVGHSDFVLLPIDTKGTRSGAVAAANQAIAQGAEIILGPIFSNNVTAVSAVAGDIPVLSFSNNPAVANGKTYTLGYQQKQAITRVLEHAQTQGIRRYALLVPQGKISGIAQEAMQEFAAQNVVTVLPLQPFTPNINGLNKTIKTLALNLAVSEQNDDSYIADSDKVAVMAVVPPSQLESLVSVMRYHDLPMQSVQLLGNLSWKIRYAMQTPELRGAVFAGPPTKSRLIFDKRYTENFNEPPTALESLAYDSVAIAAVLAKNGRNPYSSRNLETRNGFQGVDGLFYLQPNGKVDRRFAVFEITATGFPQIGIAE